MPHHIHAKARCCPPRLQVPELVLRADANEESSCVARFRASRRSEHSSIASSNKLWHVSETLKPGYKYPENHTSQKMLGLLWGLNQRVSVRVSNHLLRGLWIRHLGQPTQCR